MLAFETVKFCFPSLVDIVFKPKCECFGLGWFCIHVLLWGYWDFMLSHFVIEWK